MTTIQIPMVVSAAKKMIPSSNGHAQRLYHGDLDELVYMLCMWKNFWFTRLATKKGQIYGLTTGLWVRALAPWLRSRCCCGPYSYYKWFAGSLHRWLEYAVDQRNHLRWGYNFDLEYEI